MGLDKKKAFLVYYDNKEHIKLLDDEQCGKLFRALIDYADSGVETELEGMAKMAFSFMKLQIDRDNQKYEEQCAKNQRNGAKGGRPRKYRDVQEETAYSDDGCEAEKNFVSEKTQRFFEKPKKPDTDTETATDTETDTDTETATATATETETETDTAPIPSASADKEPESAECDPDLSSCEEMRCGSLSDGSENSLKKTPAKSAECPFSDILELYNSICLSFPRINGITGKRRRALGVLWKMHPDLSVFGAAFKRAEESRFLRSRSWADFDWLIKQDKFSRLIEAMQMHCLQALTARLKGRSIWTAGMPRHWGLGVLRREFAA